VDDPALPMEMSAKTLIFVLESLPYPPTTIPEMVKAIALDEVRSAVEEYIRYADEHRKRHLGEAVGVVERDDRIRAAEEAAFDKALAEDDESDVKGDD
jgi:hypothetical protein